MIGWKISSSLPVTGSILITHGNGGSALNRNHLAMPIHESLPLNIYILEYPGYGARGGTPTETSLLAAAEEAWQLLPKNLPVYLVSESLGTGIAAHLAKNHPREVAGIAMFVPYDDLIAVAKLRFWFMPVKLLMWDRYAPALWLKDYRGPIKFILAGLDEIVSVKLGMNLHDGYAGPKELQVVPDAYHNGVTVQSYDWWRNVLAFWQANAIKK